MSPLLPRDSTSQKYLNDLIGQPGVLTTDVVFALPQPQTMEERDVVLNISGLLWGRNSHVDSVVYKRETHRLIRGLLETGRRVTLLAHVLSNPSVDNDVPAVMEAAEDYDGAVEVEVPAGLDEARGVLASANVVIGARMHSCLNALSTGVPAIPWAYSRKFAPLLNDLNASSGIDLRSDPAPAASTLSLMSGIEQDLARVEAARALAAARLRDAGDALRLLLPHVKAA
jgi:polysaccharide pyruvyl transferase WcaK-like protein